jgi:hypothetical protein
MSDTNNNNGGVKIIIWSDEVRQLVTFATDIDTARQAVINKLAEELGPDYVGELIQGEPEVIEPNEGAVFQFAAQAQADPI